MSNDFPITKGNDYGLLNTLSLNYKIRNGHAAEIHS